MRMRCAVYITKYKLSMIVMMMVMLVMLVMMMLVMMNMMVTMMMMVVVTVMMMLVVMILIIMVMMMMMLIIIVVMLMLFDTEITEITTSVMITLTYSLYFHVSGLILLSYLTLLLCFILTQSFL